MIVDASSIIAVLRQEPGFEVFVKALEVAGDSKMSPVNFLEAAVVADRQDDVLASSGLDNLIQTANISIAPVTESHARIARQAYRDFGKGSGHRAKLNMGDCFAYALAKATGEPLLFKGNDFIHTDITSALN